MLGGGRMADRVAGGRDLVGCCSKPKPPGHPLISRCWGWRSSRGSRGLTAPAQDQTLESQRLEPGRPRQVGVGNCGRHPNLPLGRPRDPSPGSRSGRFSTIGPLEWRSFHSVTPVRGLSATENSGVTEIFGQGGPALKSWYGSC